MVSPEHRDRALSIIEALERGAEYETRVKTLLSHLELCRKYPKNFDEYEADDIVQMLLDTAGDPDCPPEIRVRAAVGVVSHDCEEASSDELTKKPDINFLWVIRRVWEAGYLRNDRPVYFSTIRDIIDSAGLQVKKSKIRSTLAMAGCPVDRDSASGQDIEDLFKGHQSSASLTDPSQSRSEFMPVSRLGGDMRPFAKWTGGDIFVPEQWLDDLNALVQAEHVPYSHAHDIVLHALEKHLLWLRTRKDTVMSARRESDPAAAWNAWGRAVFGLRDGGGR